LGDPFSFLNHYLIAGKVITHSEVGNKPERGIGRSMSFGNTPLGLKFISILQGGVIYNDFKLLTEKSHFVRMHSILISKDGR